MPLTEVETKEVKRTIGLLSDVQPEFVSLVSHAANKMPFRFAKNDNDATATKGGENLMSMVIQSVLLPNGTEITRLADMEGLEFLNDLNTAKSDKFSEFTRLTQVPLEKFDEDSLSMVKLAKGENLFALVGKLKDEATVENPITLSESFAEKVQKQGVFPVGDRDAIYEAVLAETFRRELSEEMWAMEDVVYGVLKQSGMAPNKRKQAITAAIDAFKQFVTMGLEALGTEKLDIEVPTRTGRSINKEDSNAMALQFKDEKEFSEKVGTIVADTLKAFKEEEAKAKAEADAKAKEEAEAKALADAQELLEKKTKGEDQFNLEKSIQTAVEAAVKPLSEKVEKLENGLVTDPKSGDDTDNIVTKTDDTLDEEKPNPSVFAGMLTGGKRIPTLGEVQ